MRRTTEKGWIFLFTCLTNRAVYVEIRPSIDGSSCVVAVERFVCRCRTTAINWSDKSTNFVDAGKKLREKIKKWKDIKTAARLSQPNAPDQGGIWERPVRSFKQILYTVFITRRLTDEVLNTTFSLVEYALNARPITPVSANSSNLSAKTPNQFILINQATSIQSIVYVNEIDPIKRYASSQS